MLADRHLNDYLPEGWYYNGYYYLDVNGTISNTHPNLELIIKTYLDDTNGQIGEINREVQKEWKNDAKKYDN